jgi:hypothetical protein|eukprot:Opistho-2@85629
MRKLIIAIGLLIVSQSADAQLPMLNANFKKAIRNVETKKLIREKNLLTEKDLAKYENLIEESTKSSNDSLTEFNLFKAGHIKKLDKLVYNDPKVIDLLESFSVQTIGDGTYISGELVNAFFGPVRFGLGGSFKTTGDSTKDQAIKSNLQKILTAGGSINTTFSLPLYYTRPVDDQLHFGVFLMTNWAITPKDLDTAQAGLTMSSEFNFNNQSGLHLHFDVTSKGRNVNLFADVKATYNWGNTLTEKLQMTDFSLVDMRVGVNVNELVSLYVSGPLYSTTGSVMSVPFLLNLQFSPNKIVKELNGER